MLKKFRETLAEQSKAKALAEQNRNLIRMEAKIGGQLFGEVPKGHRREFFCLDERTWVWHEEWIDRSGVKQTKTTRYDIRPSGVIKTQDNGGYTAISPNEAENLKQAMILYNKRIKCEIYQQA